MPRTLIAGNWKMHKTAAETLSFLDAFLPLAADFPKEIDVMIAPPFTALAAAGKRLRNESRVALGAQTVHWDKQGAYTGEISAPMLLEHGVTYTIVGHSERRAYFSETDLTVNLKVKGLLGAGITPIVAVGETLSEREAGQTDARILLQISEGLKDLSDEQLGRVVIAYEPIWAIGTGENCKPDEANRVMGKIRNTLEGLQDVPILYGGSMKADNVAAYMQEEHINGGLVGGASLDAATFATLVANAAVR